MDAVSRMVNFRIGVCHPLNDDELSGLQLMIRRSNDDRAAIERFFDNSAARHRRLEDNSAATISADGVIVDRTFEVTVRQIKADAVLTA